MAAPTGAAWDRRAVPGSLCECRKLCGDLNPLTPHAAASPPSLSCSKPARTVCDGQPHAVRSVPGRILRAHARR
eukprot:6682272-Prymnesium_polylepis.1